MIKIEIYSLEIVRDIGPATSKIDNEEIVLHYLGTIDDYPEVSTKEKNNINIKNINLLFFFA